MGPASVLTAYLPSLGPSFHASSNHTCMSFFTSRCRGPNTLWGVQGRWERGGTEGMRARLTSMLPVSGAEQLNTSEPIPLRPMTSLRKAYSRLERPGPMSRCLSAWGTLSLRWAILAAMSAGSHRFQSPSARAFACAPSHNHFAVWLDARWPVMNLEEVWEHAELMQNRSSAEESGEH